MNTAASVFFIALAMVGGAAGAFLVIVLSIHVEDWRGSTTRRAPGPFTRGTRRVLGLYVNHAACAEAGHPDQACPRCRRSFEPSLN